MLRPTGLSQIRIVMCTGLAVVTLMVGSGFAGIPQNVKDLVPDDPAKSIPITVWLKQRNQAALDNLVRQMYDQSSPNYHHWLTLDEYNANFAPSSQEAVMVRDFLVSHGLQVTAMEKNNHYVRARGLIADIEKAFQVQISRFTMNGETHRAASTEPLVAGQVGSVIAAVQGFDDFKYTSFAKRPASVDGKPVSGIPLSSAISDGLVFSANCFRPPETVKFTTAGGGPSAVYSGNRYGANIDSLPPNLAPCGYDAAEMQHAYGVDTLHSRGLDGSGQTVVIVDAFGSNTIFNDTNTFSRLNGLPSLTSSNFQIFKPNGSANCGSACMAGLWNFETSIDVQWSHAMAPGANIALVLAVNNDFDNLDIANLFAIDNLLGNVISNSFGTPEVLLVEFLPPELVVENLLAEMAASLGISLDVSSGDDGDFLAVDQEFGINAPSVIANANSPFATGVGGTSLFLNPNNTIKFQTGWGLNETRIADPSPNPPVVPPLVFGFLEGSGGGTSVVYAKPSFQKKLPGKFRKVPDIAMEADPETGAEIVISDPVSGEQVVEVFGGTSLSCPMFSGLWAIANQAAKMPLGQAAPYVYNLPASAISDIVQIGSAHNVTGVITLPGNPPTTMVQTADDLAGPLENTKLFVSALFNSPSSTRWDVFTFGTDSSLTTGPGWDNVTGVGTPKGVAFINGVVAQTKP
jgi:subtilase family serine protease